MMNEMKFLMSELVKFRDERDWAQFHDSKNLAIAISIEAAELNEIFLWKTPAESEKIDKNLIKEELADILTFSLLLAEKHGFDVGEIVLEKMKINAQKYPIEKSKGTAKKYNAL
jgi:NTP pyrophosphatase (non-canonical NTP hydrolase)